MDENKRLEELESRIANIEKALNISGRISQVSDGALPPPPRYAQVSRVFPEAYKPAGIAAPTSQPSKSSKGDVESYIGRWILGVVGIVAILFGASICGRVFKNIRLFYPEAGLGFYTFPFTALIGFIIF